MAWNIVHDGEQRVYQQNVNMTDGNGSVIALTVSIRDDEPTKQVGTIGIVYRDRPRITKAYYFFDGIFYGWELTHDGTVRNSSESVLGSELEESIARELESLGREKPEMKEILIPAIAQIKR